MKGKYVLITITCFIMFFTCYEASKITSSASAITNNNIITTSKPYISYTPTLVPYDIKPTTPPSKTPSKKPSTNKIKNTVAPTMATTNKDTKKNTTSNKSNYRRSKKNTNLPLKIPTIYTPYLSGKIIYQNEEKTAIMDVSNCNKGYVGIKYLGNNHKVKVQIKKGNQIYNYDLASDGQYDIFPLQLGNGTYSLSVLENISGTQYISVLNKSINVSINNTLRLYLYPNQYVWFTQNSAVVKKSAEVCHGYTKTIDKISAIFEYVTSNIKYDHNKATTVKSGYLPNVDSILRSKKGICFDYAAVMAAMCRAQGIPTKLITGYVSPNGVYHAWNEVYTQEKGWITVSFYLSKVGYNIVDPTFYSNMNNTKDAAKYIGNGSNYRNYHIY